jgi:hypothetical protein
MEKKLVTPRITQIKQSSEKILIFEEDERTIDDGNGSMYCTPNAYDKVNLLSLRHDGTKRKVLDVPPTDPSGPIPNLDGKGVCGFCDGHADYIERSKAHFKNACLANAADVPAAYP